MRFKIFSTVKPKRFGFHTRYYNENKLSSDEKVTVEKGSFTKFRNRYDTETFDSREQQAKNRRRTLLISIMLVAGLTFVILRFTNSIERILALLLQ